MPTITRSPRRTRSALAVAGAALMAAAALPALASAACPTTATTQPFTTFGDTARYTLVSNGGFESGTTGWTLNGASVVTGNETWKVRASTDTKSLRVPAGASLVSPTFCVGIAQPTWRFFAKRVSGAWGGINLSVRYKSAAGTTVQTGLGYVDGTSMTSWSPTAVLPLGSSLPLWNSSQTLQVQLVFTPLTGGGAFQIDDVYYDPYVR